MTCAVSVFAQGTVVFNNRNGYTSHVYGGGQSQLRGGSPADNPAGTNVYAPLLLIGTTGGYAAGTTYASLLGQSLSGPFAAGNLGTAFGGGTATTFRTGAAAGNIVASTATFNNIPKDAAGANATFEMVAWDNSSGLYPTWLGPNMGQAAWIAGTIAGGMSAPFQFTAGIGGDVNTPPIWGDITAGQSSTFNIYIVPEPTTIALAGLGAAALVIFRRRK